ncbi:MAG: sugar-binding transcriptional regulator [Chloroflexi bacterium]|nr:MAG: sugar-binding transcriptional regulator [Chloroflexota bacterium]
MARVEELRLLARIAQLYYVKGMNQSAIADQLDLSQATISRLIQRALSEGIVRITVSMPPGIYSDLEDALLAKYGLKEVIVVDCDTPENEANIQHALGSAAAFYLESTLKKGDVIGISSWSATLLAMVDAMRPFPKSFDARVVQILGGIGNPDAEVHATRLTDRLAKLIQGSATFLTAPGVVGSEEARRILLDDPYVSATVALFDRITVALVGIGSVQPSELLAHSGNVFSAEELEQVRREGAVGDVCLRLFDGNGAQVRTALDKRVIGISQEQLQRVPRTVGVAGGARKRSAIQGALRGRWINVLITDRFSAEALADPAHS